MPLERAQQVTGSTLPESPKSPAGGTAKTRSPGLDWGPRVLLGAAVLAFCGLAAVGIFWAGKQDTLWPWLQPSADATAFWAVAGWTAALLVWYRSRREQGRPIGFIVVATSALFAFVLALVPLVPCTLAEDNVLTPIWNTLIVFVGTSPEAFTEGQACPGGVPLAVQVARLLAMVAVFGTALALGLNVASRQVERVRARYSQFQDVVIGLDESGPALVRELMRRLDPSAPGETRRPRGVLVLVPEPAAALEGQARRLGALTVPLSATGSVGTERLQAYLQPYLTRFGGVSASRVWVMDADPMLSARIAEAAYTVLCGASSDPARPGLLRRLADNLNGGTDRPRPTVRAVLADRALAEDFRVRWVSADAARGPNSPVRSPVCPAQVTATELVGRIARHYRDPATSGAGYDLVICGDGELAEALLHEYAVRRWEADDLAKAWEEHIGAGTDSCGFPCAKHDREHPVPGKQNSPMDLLVGGRLPETVRVVCPDAKRLVRHVAHALPAALRGAMGSVDDSNEDWRRYHPSSPTGRPLAIVVAQGGDPMDHAIGSRLLTGQPAGSNLWLPTNRQDEINPQLDREAVLHGHPVHEYALNLFLRGQFPEDTWQRIARHQHERYRRVEFKDTATRNPWWYGSGDSGHAGVPPTGRAEQQSPPTGQPLSEKKKRDNVDSVLFIMAWFVRGGYQWERSLDPCLPLGDPPYGLTAQAFRDLVTAEFKRFRLAEDPNYEYQPEDLTDGEIGYTESTIKSVLTPLAALGYRPAPVGGGGTAGQ